MGITERHWFENEEPELTERQLEDAVREQKDAYKRGYQKGYSDRDKDLALIKEQEKHKTGKWEVKPSNKEQGERDFIWWKCSECGQVIYSESEHDRKEFHKYCGRCGAKMESR